MRVIIPGSILSALNFGFNNIMRASGYPQKAMLTMIICGVINVLLVPLFIYGFHWGIAGAAHATNISYFVGTVWVLTHFMQKKSVIRFRKRNFQLNKQIIKSILNIGMSPFSMQIASSLVIVLLNIALIKQGGDLAVGALGIQNSIATLFLMFIIGLNQGIQPILGYNYGARNYDRMFSALKTAALIATSVTTVGFLLCTLFPRALVSIFTTDEELKRIAANALRISVIMFPLIGSQVIFTSFFQSIGKAKISMLLSLTRQVLFLIPAVLVLPSFFGLNGVWASLPVADFLAVIVTSSTLFFFIRRFEKKNDYIFRINQP
jgi:putative MATE family efflux protein